MSADRFNELIIQALPDATAPSAHEQRRLAALFPAATAFRLDGDITWALFAIRGGHISSVDVDALQVTQQQGVQAAFVATDYSGVKAVAPLFVEHEIHVICEVAGSGGIVAPVAEEIRGTNAQDPPCTRVPRSLLEAAAAAENLPDHLGDATAWLIQKYETEVEKYANGRDGAEADALLEFAKQELLALGLEPDKLAGTAFIRSLEMSGMGPLRDHFFHSFQNYFLGVPIIAQLRAHFDDYKDQAKLHWDVDPFEVWFLTAMWHDVGYANQKLGDVLSATYGEQPDEETLALVRGKAFLDDANTNDGIRILASLIGRLLSRRVPPTEWTEPHEQTTLTPRAKGIRAAIFDNIAESHGAFGGVRLYRDYVQSINSMEEDKRAIARQTVLLAGASIPFHDWYFRRSVRAHCGECVIPTTNLLLGCLLTYIDSIQDDRRDLSGGIEPRVILRSLSVRDGSRIEADIDMTALESADILQKIIEARDVAVSIGPGEDGLEFIYPGWMVG